MRIGRDVRYFDYSYYGSGTPGDEETVAFAEHALDVMRSLGATIVDTDTGDVFAYTDDEFTALLFEFKAQIAQYLATLTHTNMRTLSDLIAFNNAHCAQELVYYGQEIFELANSTSGDLNDPTYVAARSHATNTARAGIDGAMARDHLDAIVAPHLTNSTGPAVAGYPNISLPIGVRSSGKPVGLLIYSTFLHEPQLIGFAYDLEQALNARVQPQFLSSPVPVPNAGLCNGLPKKPKKFKGKAHLPHGRNF
jgi:amidase